MENSLATLLGALSARFEVTVLGTCAEVAGFVAARRPGATVRIVPEVAGGGNLARLARLVRTVRALRPDLLQASMGELYAAQHALTAAVVTGTPSVAVIHGVLPRHSQPKDFLFRWVMQRVTAVGAVSSYVAREVEAEFRLPSGSVHLLYGGVEHPGARPPVRREHPDEVVVGAVGRLAPEKGFDVLVRAMTALPACRLVIVGDGRDRSRLESLAARSGVAARVSFAGWVEPPWSAKLSFDLLVAPSRAEGFGLSVVEAMLAETPVVAASVGGLGELVHDGITGLLVPPEDPSALAAAVARLAADPELRATMGKRGRDSVVGRYSVEGMVRAYEQVFDAVART